MKGHVSFHPVDLGFFDGLIAPLTSGKKVDPDPFVRRASRIRRNEWVARRFVVSLEQLVEESLAPQPDPQATRWQRLRANLERVDFRPDEMARRAAKVLEPELHVEGRPFLVMDGSAEKVAAAVEAYVAAESEESVESIVRAQIAHADPLLAERIEPADIAEPSSDLLDRNDLLALLTKIYELARAAREGRRWTAPDARPRPASEALPEELPWRALSIHARAHPFWVARDVDGLETICKAAGVPPPECLSPAWRVFAEACDAFPALKEALGLELQKPQDVGAFVAPRDVSALLTFLTDHGARIIGAATRAGEGPAATTLLRKIKECATYAARHELGYLEASGIERESSG